MSGLYTSRVGRRPVSCQLLDRTVAAIVFGWDGKDVTNSRASATGLRRRVETLCNLGVHVAVVSSIRCENVDDQLHARPSGPGRLFLAVNPGAEVFVVGRDGPRLLSRRVADARVRGDAEHVELGLTGQPNSMRAILVRLAALGVGPGLVLVVGADMGDLDGVAGTNSPTYVAAGTQDLFALLDEQLSRHRHRQVPEIDPDPRWTLQFAAGEGAPDRSVDVLCTLGSGGLGTAGAMLQSAAGVLAAGVYEGTESSEHLLVGPSWSAMASTSPIVEEVRTLDLRTGVLTSEATTSDGSAVRVFRFASVGHPGVMALRAEAAVGQIRAGLPLRVCEGSPISVGYAKGRRWVQVNGSHGSGIAAAAVQRRGYGLDLTTVERIAAYSAGPTPQATISTAIRAVDAAQLLGFDRLLAEHRAGWAGRWDAVDVSIPDDPDAELRLRFALFHLWGCTGRTDELAVGARGLSGGGYAGHVFWDADAFVLPALASIDPAAADAMVRYRINRLATAGRRARAEGFGGARFPWESASTGEDVTPTSGQVGGARVPILTGAREEHVTADVAWAAVHSATWSGVAMGPNWSGRDLVLETARYWSGRCRRAPDGSAHLEGVIGPDEYHELVNDNAYTNVMARWNLRAAARMAPGSDIGEGERDEWLSLADALVDGYDPDTGRYEQFRGYDLLEPLLMREVAAPPIAADLLLGRTRVAASQVIKQPDVLMLHHLVPDEVAAGSLVANLDFYEPRTAHGSSLSPAVTSALQARAGRPDEALRMLRLALSLDLDDLSHVTAAGLHLATLGGAWQALLTGFLGVRVIDSVLHIDPVLPQAWPTLHVRFRCLRRRVRISVTDGHIEVCADGPLRVALPDADETQLVDRTRGIRQARSDRRTIP